MAVRTARDFNDMVIATLCKSAAVIAQGEVCLRAHLSGEQHVSISCSCITRPTRCRIGPDGGRCHRIQELRFIMGQRRVNVSRESHPGISAAGIGAEVVAPLRADAILWQRAAFDDYAK
jgi:hypothetical protein